MPEWPVVTDIDPPAADTHAENILVRELGKEETILPRILAVLTGCQQTRRFAAEHAFELMVDDAGNLGLYRIRGEKQDGPSLTNDRNIALTFGTVSGC